MMLGVRDYSIRKKLTAMSMLTSGAALVLACSAFLAYEWTAFRSEIVARVATQAQIIGSNSASALLFEDPRSAEQTLAGLKAEPEVRAAALYTREGRLFASYRRPGQGPDSPLPQVAGLQADQHSFEGGILVLFRQVAEKGEALGTVYIESDLQGMDQRVKRYAAILLLVLGVSFLAAWFISSRLQPLIARPVLQLAETARAVSLGRDYSVRAQPGNRDEVGLLIDTFNQMLAQIEERDGELQEARTELENRVAERTAELQRMAIIVESSDDAIIHNDLSSNVLTWNRGATALFGYTAQEVLGRPTPMIPPDRQEERRRLGERIVQGGRWEQYEMELLHKDGRRLDVSLTMSPVRNEQGEVVGAATIIRDITERKRAEQALRSVTDRLNLAMGSAHVGTFDWEISTGRLTWDPYTYPLFGQNPDTFLLSYETAMNCLHPQDRQPVERDIGAAVAGSGQFESEFRVIWPDGSLHALASRGQVYRDQNGNAARMAGVMWDVTRSRQAEEEIRHLNRELEERVAELGVSNRELEAFSYSVSHDLRAPLRQIHGFTKVVVEKYGPQFDAQAQHYLGRIEEGASQMGRLIDDLLNLARLGRRELKRQPTPLAQLVEEVRDELATETNGRKVEWRIQPLPPVDCDPGLMKQVFANLLANSLKYTRPRDQAVIEVGQRAVNGEQAIFVRDNGVGFNMKYADKLFGVFQRLHRSDEFEGTGVGLATVQRIVHKHGGRIWAESEVDQGATFSFTLGRQDTSESQEQTVEEAVR